MIDWSCEVTSLATSSLFVLLSPEIIDWRVLVKILNKSIAVEFRNLLLEHF